MKQKMSRCGPHSKVSMQEQAGQRKRTEARTPDGCGSQERLRQQSRSDRRVLQPSAPEHLPLHMHYTACFCWDAEESLTGFSGRV